MPACPNCASSQTVKNGRIHNGKQRFKCHECGRQFVAHPQKRVIDQTTRELIDRLLLEQISLAGIARATQVSEQWLLSLCQREICTGTTPCPGNTQKKGRLTIQCDEIWSFVDNNANIQPENTEQLKTQSEIILGSQRSSNPVKKQSRDTWMKYPR